MNSIRAIICDVYRTILHVGEAPQDAEERWIKLCRDAFGRDSGLSLEDLSDRCREIISEDHHEARERGILYPEVHWPAVMKRALPGLETLPHDDLDIFLFDHAQLFRTLRMNPGCATVLRECRERGLLLGIASNAQAYTLRELDLALREAGLDASIFQSDLTFWSFEHGFSKPNPHAFQILRARLQAHGVSQSETLMIGDREDNDITPARTAGWRTWLFPDSRNHPGNGDWDSLGRVLFESAEQ
jgi:putative hydrolase of the HAD superfamily